MTGPEKPSRVVVYLNNGSQQSISPESIFYRGMSRDGLDVWRVELGPRLLPKVIDWQCDLAPRSRLEFAIGPER